ncbi:hypothetical protein [Pseudonocardia sp. NPDC049635]|uniref:hypothetical protein n=1 Tax=Pseudonocardia sp. NPDC049635 TaxID=3155506 RepID=UPI0033EBF290
MSARWPDAPAAREIVALTACQQAPPITRDTDGVLYLVHLVRVAANGGTPGPFLCGVDRFGPDAGSWSIGGGVSGPAVRQGPCPGCVTRWRRDYPGITEVRGSVGAAELMAARG